MRVLAGWPLANRLFIASRRGLMACRDAAERGPVCRPVRAESKRIPRMEFQKFHSVIAGLPIGCIEFQHEIIVARIGDESQGCVAVRCLTPLPANCHKCDNKLRKPIIEPRPMTIPTFPASLQIGEGHPQCVWRPSANIAAPELFRDEILLARSIGHTGSNRGRRVREFIGQIDLREAQEIPDRSTWRYFSSSDAVRLSVDEALTLYPLPK